MFIGMTGLTQAASAGHFAIDRETGTGLMRSLSQMRDHLDEVLADADGLARATPLGDLPEALVVSDLNQQVAAGDAQSLRSVLLQFRASLEQAHQAVQIGMVNYEQIDTEIAEAYERGHQEQLGSTHARASGEARWA